MTQREIDHTADVSKKVDGDCISRQAAIDAMKDMYRAAEKWLRDATDDVTKARAESCMASLVEIKLRIEKIPAAQPEPHWIPCSERLPERADNVIICCKAGDYTLVSTGRYLYKFKMWYVDVVGDFRDGVTAWMPLPEPYRGGGKE